MKIIRIVFFLLLGLLFAGCNLPAAAQPNETPVSAAETEEPLAPTAAEEPTQPPTAEPTLTLTPEPTATANLEPTQTVFTPFTARVWAANVNMRVNPGYLFPVLRVLEEGADFKVLGKAPGGEWLFVQRPDNITGWVYTRLVDSDYDLQAAPVMQPSGVQILTGELVTESGEPLNGIHFAISQGSGPNAPRNDANTDENGKFIAFMPTDASGVWQVSFVAISCTSIVMDADCNTRPEYNGTVDPVWVEVTLPVNQPLQFLWK